MSQAPGLVGVLAASGAEEAAPATANVTSKDIVAMNVFMSCSPSRVGPLTMSDAEGMM